MNQKSPPDCLLFYLRQLAFSILAVLLLLAIPNRGQAQIKSSTITGTVTDPSGAHIPDAQVIVTRQSTNVAVQVTSNSDGEYSVPYLTPGTYSVAVAKSGFKAYRVEDVDLTSNATVRINAKLQLGETNIAVEVNANAEQLQTDSTTVQGTVTKEVIESIPNINSNPMYYATLQAGVFQQKGSFDTTGQQSWGIGTQSRQTLSSISVNGGQSLANSIQLDGVSIQGSGWNEASVLPNQDGLQEVKVQTNNYSAEYGRGQGIISFITKSGTNQYHGSLLYKHRNEALNANTFTNNAYGIPRQKFRAHTWGATFGGPIKKDKIFFFASYEGLYHTEGVVWQDHVPTLAERAGDFSQTLIPGLNAQPEHVRLFDPFSVRQVGSNVYQRAEIPNAIIPNPDPAALYLMSFYPKPNRTPTDVYNSNNWYNTGVKPFRRDSISSRVDGSFGRHSVYIAGGIEKGSIRVPQPYGPDNPFFVDPGGSWSQVQQDNNPYAMIGDTVILSPTLVLDVRYGIARINSQDYVASGSKPFDYSRFGVTPAVQGLINDNKAAPDYCPQSFDCLSYGAQQQKDERGVNHSAVGSISKVAGKWTLKAGAEYRVNLYNVKNIGSAAFQVGDRWSQQNYTQQYIDATGSAIGSLNTDPAQNGFGGASQLLGAGWLEAARAAIPTLAAKYTALYSQNDWRVNNKLTVNLGLRWDVQPGPTERYNHMAAIDLTKGNPFTGLGAYAFPGQDGYSRNLWDTEWHDFAPRLGAAYQVNANTVVRGGYGITYMPTNTGNGQWVSGNGFFSPYTGGSGFVYGTGVKDGVPVGKYYSDAVNPIFPAVGSNLDNPALYGGGGELTDRHLKNGRVQQWNVVVEHDFAAHWVASLGYAATAGEHLYYRGRPLQSQQLISDQVLGQWRSAYLANGGTNSPGDMQVTNPYQPDPNNLLPFAGGTLSGAQVPLWYTYMPYPMFAGVTPNMSNGTSNYQSMIASVRHAFSSGFQLDAYYTWSKSIDDVHTAGQSNDGIQYGGEQNMYDYLDVRNSRNNRMLSYNDIPHRLALDFVYESPFGRGKPLLAQSRLATWLLGGWKIGGSAILQAGTPIAIKGASGSFTQRPDRIAGAKVELPKQYQHFYDGATLVTLPDGRQITPCFGCYLKYNPDAFSGRVVQLASGDYVPDIYWFGDSALTYSDIRSPGRYNLDASLTRSFRIRESMSLQLAVNVYNVLNYANWKPAGASLGGTNLVDDSSIGLKPGMLGSDFGSNYFSAGTYDPRQAQIEAKFVF